MVKQKKERNENEKRAEESVHLNKYVTSEVHFRFVAIAEVMWTMQYEMHNIIVRAIESFHAFLRCQSNTQIE